jgi:hypothetical protein
MPAPNIHLPECYDWAHTCEGLARQPNEPQSITRCHSRGYAAPYSGMAVEFKKRLAFWHTACMATEQTD